MLAAIETYCLPPHRKRSTSWGVDAAGFQEGRNTLLSGTLGTRAGRPPPVSPTSAGAGRSPGVPPCITTLKPFSRAALLPASGPLPERRRHGLLQAVLFASRTRVDSPASSSAKFRRIYRLPPSEADLDDGRAGLHEPPRRRCMPGRTGGILFDQAEGLAREILRPVGGVHPASLTARMSAVDWQSSSRVGSAPHPGPAPRA